MNKLQPDLEFETPLTGTERQALRYQKLQRIDAVEH